MTKLTIEFEKQKISIESESIVSASDFIEYLFRPAMLGLQFHPDTVDKYLPLEK